jgi:hypothetical protein
VQEQVSETLEKTRKKAAEMSTLKSAARPGRYKSQLELGDLAGQTLRSCTVYAALVHRDQNSVRFAGAQLPPMSCIILISLSLFCTRVVQHRSAYNRPAKALQPHTQGSRSHAYSRHTICPSIHRSNTVDCVDNRLCGLGLTDRGNEHRHVVHGECQSWGAFNVSASIQLVTRGSNHAQSLYRL